LKKLPHPAGISCGVLLFVLKSLALAICSMVRLPHFSAAVQITSAKHSCAGGEVPSAIF
jgi:hypothetical protein